MTANSATAYKVRYNWRKGKECCWHTRNH